MNASTIEALNFFNKAQATFEMLYDRWQDEKAYEDINDYQKPLESIARECGITITKMTKRPFGCHFSVDNKIFALSLSAKSYSYKRIA